MKKQLLKERFQELAGIKSLSEEEALGGRGTDKRTLQVISDTLQLIRRSGDATLAMDVMEEIGKEFKIKGCVGEFEFSGGAPDPNSGLPKMDPDNWAFGDNINPGNTKDQDTKRKAYTKRFGDKSPGQR